MFKFERLNHRIWDCKYHLIWRLKDQEEVFYRHIRKYPGEGFWGAMVTKAHQSDQGRSYTRSCSYVVQHNPIV